MVIRYSLIPLLVLAPAVPAAARRRAAADELAKGIEARTEQATSCSPLPFRPATQCRRRSRRRSSSSANLVYVISYHAGKAELEQLTQ